MTLRQVLLSGIFIILSLFASAQPTTRHLAVEQYPLTSLTTYLKQLKNAREDTAKVHLLLKISSIYHWNGLKGWADSSIYFARQAALLSKSLHDDEGHNEATFLVCKSLLEKKDFDHAKEILRDVYGEQYIRILLVLSEYFINDKDGKPDELRKAYPFLKKANQLSAKQQSRHWMTESAIALAKYHFRLGEIDEGKNCWYRVIRYYEQIGDKAGQAHWWQDLARYLPEMGTYALQIHSFGKAKRLFGQIGDIREYADCLQEEGTIHLQNNRPDLAEKLYLAELDTLKSAHLTRRFFASYKRLSELYRRQNDLDKALQYAFLGLESLKSLKDTSRLNSIYWTIGDIYHSLGDHQESIKYYKLVLSTSPLHIIRTYTLIKLLVDAQIKTGNAAEGLKFLQTFLRTTASPQTALNKQLVAYMFGNCYAAMKDLKTAEKYYLDVIRLNDEVEMSEKFWWRNRNSVSGAQAYVTIAGFYTQRRKFTQAARYVKNALASANLTPSFEMDCRYLIFRIDSATGNYVSSIRNYQRYIFLKDSIQSTTKDKQFAVLKANFKTARKESDIQLLRKEASLRQRQLELSARAERFTYAGIVALLLLLGIVYYSYKVKQNKTKQLEEQQRIISIKNSALLRLVDEKEWLLKEVHHRVKNNLQIVIGLLNSQSVHLKEEVAVNAIAESRHRIQAISMLHQRIYQTENMVGIAMGSYIYEMLYYLDDSFNMADRIIFNVRVENIVLDLVQAVPIGLILNEAITNSLKYAFGTDREGEIKVSFTKTIGDRLTLCIADNGIGLPENFDIEETNTFGLKLIKGLTDDLEGEFTIHGQPGTRLIIEFTHKLVITHLSSREDQLGAIEL